MIFRKTVWILISRCFDCANSQKIMSYVELFIFYCFLCGKKFICSIMWNDSTQQSRHCIPEIKYILNYWVRREKRRHYFQRKYLRLSQFRYFNAGRTQQGSGRSLFKILMGQLDWAIYFPARYLSIMVLLPSRIWQKLL